MKRIDIDELNGEGWPLLRQAWWLHAGTQSCYILAMVVAIGSFAVMPGWLALWPLLVIAILINLMLATLAGDIRQIHIWVLQDHRDTLEKRLAVLTETVDLVGAKVADLEGADG